MFKPSVLIAVFLFVVAASIYFTTTSESILEEIDSAPKVDTNIPYAQVFATKSLLFNDHGEINYKLDAELLKHYAVDGNQTYTIASKPELEILVEQTPWHIRADYGKFLQSNEISLWDNVRVENVNLQDQMVTLETSSLMIYLDQKYAHTDSPVTIFGAIGKIEAVGMTADFTGEKITFTSKVRGYHEPN